MHIQGHKTSQGVVLFNKTAIQRYTMKKSIERDLLLSLSLLLLLLVVVVVIVVVVVVVISTDLVKI